MTTADNLLALGPVALYLFDETSGTALVDASGNARNGTYSGTPTFSEPGLTADSAASVAFNGTDAKAEVAYDAGWMAWTEFSVVASILLPAGFAGGYSTVLGIENMLEVWAEDASTGVTVGGVLYTDTPDTAGVQSAAAAVPFDTAARVALTYDGAMARFYVDGALVEEEAITGAPVDGAAFRVASWNGSDFYVATVDEVGLFDRALSAAEVAGLEPAPARTGFGMVLDSTATVSAEAPLEAFPPGPGGLPDPVQHIITPTVPAPTLSNGRPL